MTIFKDEIIKEEYIKHWETKGLNYITPLGLENPEGFNIEETLSVILPGSLNLKDYTVCEVGCGTGRLSSFFNPNLYVGLDINEEALKIAKAKNPKYAFSNSKNIEKYPHSDITLYYTVCLHIPDTEIEKEFSKVDSEFILICEIMNPEYRKNRYNIVYDISNQRSLEDYCDILHKLGYRQHGVTVTKPYEYYKDEYITFALFRKVIK